MGSALALSVTRFFVNEKLLYAKVLWKPNKHDLFNIQLYDGNTIWSGRFSYDFASKYQESCNESEAQYNNNVKKALKKDRNFIFGFNVLPDDNNTAIFSWKKKVIGSETIVHGCVPIHRKDVKQSKAFILDFLLAENQDLKRTIIAFNLSNTELTANLDKCKRDLDKFVEIKSTLESGLYDKFEQLLNVKKRRLLLLEKKLQSDATTSGKNIAR